MNKQLHIQQNMSMQSKLSSCPPDESYLDES